MESRMIIQAFILVLIVSLACATIYAVETGETYYNDSSNGEDGIHLSESIDTGAMVDSVSSTHATHHADLPRVYF